MNLETRTKWVNALRSGNYEQGQEQLRCHNQYCCLGVLCDIMGTQWKEYEYIMGLYQDEFGNTDMPNEEIIAMINVQNKNFADTLVSMNDNDGATFDEIANYIEENLVTVD